LRQTLIAFCKDKKNECGDKAVLKAINNYYFWTDVEELIDILRPIYLYQKRSGSTRFTVCEIRKRWLTIRKYLSTFNRKSDDFMKVFDARFSIQISELYLAVHHLLPENVKEKYASGE
jgi:hypothetical protein